MTLDETVRDLTKVGISKSEARRILLAYIGELDPVYAKYPSVTFTCIAWPPQHEIGCRCKDNWTRADLLDALLVKKEFEENRDEAVKRIYGS